MSIPVNAKRSRELRLLAVLAAAGTFALAQRHFVNGSVLDGDAGPASITSMARARSLREKKNEIASELKRQLAEWKRVQEGMLVRDRAPIVMSTVSELLTDLAESAEVRLGQPNVAIDSAAPMHRVTAHFSLQGTPEAIAAFLDTVESSPTGMTTRSLQITRTPATSANALTWAGAMDVELLLRRDDR